VKSQIQFIKNQIRQEIKAKLMMMTSEEYHSLNLLLEKHFFDLPILQKSRTIMIYYSIDHEVATHSIICKLLKAGKVVALPTCVDKKNIRAGIIQDLDQLIPGVLGIKEPSPSVLEMAPAEIDMAIVPGIAFDRNGNRLGHGAGYYDRFLRKSKAYKLGLAFDFQILDNLVFEEHDVPMNAFLTPSTFQEIQK
jgi:5-formyltetrahydrofolate cyclo-ligase